MVVGRIILFLTRFLQIALVHIERHPAHDIGQGGLGEDVGDRIAHTEVGRYGSVEDTLGFAFGTEDGENIGGRAADIDTDRFDIHFIGDALDDEADRAGSRHDGGIGPFHQLAISGRLRHDMLHEQVVDLLAGRKQVFAFENRTEIIDYIERYFFLQANP